MSLSPKARIALREMFGGRCAYCGCELPAKGWHADHVEPIWREWWKRSPLVRWEFESGRPIKIVERQKVGVLRPENERANNYFPACAPCNIDKMVLSVEEWRKSLERRVEVCRRNHAAFRHAERFGRLVVVTEPLVFWFEKFAESATSSPVVKTGGQE